MFPDFPRLQIDPALFGGIFPDHGFHKKTDSLDVRCFTKVFWGAMEVLPWDLLEKTLSPVRYVVAYLRNFGSKVRSSVWSYRLLFYRVPVFVRNCGSTMSAHN